MRRAGALLPVLVLLAACGGGDAGGGGARTPGSALIALNVPSSTDRAVAGTITRGAGLAVEEINAAGGVQVGGARVQLTLRTYDDASDPQRAASNVTTAIADGAVGIVEDGVGARLSGARTQAAGVPEIVTWNGVAALGDGSLPSVFRLGLGNAATTTLLSTYVTRGGRTTVAIIHDDTQEARDADAQLHQALPTASGTIGPDLEVSATAPTLDAQLTAVRESHAGALIVWGGAAFTGRVLAAVHAAQLGIAVYAGPQGESPTVRQVAGLAASEGLAFIDSRMTSEANDTAWPAFEHSLAAAEGGPVDAGVKDAAGDEIRQPPDTDLYAYDAVRLIAAGVAKAGTAVQGRAILDAFLTVTVRSANGDSRGFRRDTHEGISDGDLYIARIHDNQYEPVKDEPLSATLPTEDEILAHFH